MHGHQGSNRGGVMDTYYEPESGFVLTLLVNSNQSVQDARFGLLASG